MSGFRAPPTLACGFVIAGLAACGGGPEGLRPTPAGDGPRIVIDWDAQPLPEIPFPNDLATRPDPFSPTGLRLNIAVDAPTELERETLGKVNELSGFGIYMPISVRFTDVLDLDDIAARQAPDLEFHDDAVYLIDLSPGSPTYLQPAELDVGHGRFPFDVIQNDRYFPNDSRANEPSIVFDTVDEDLNGNGRLDWGEDTDYDGWLDLPNVHPADIDLADEVAVRDNLLTWYERVTDTLILRPTVPLREQTTYAVVLTERLIGADGQPVRSPWAWINHTRQTAALEPLLDLLGDAALGGLELEDVAFAWTFTTGRVTGDLVDLRRGLDGEGPFASLATDFPARVSEASAVHERDDLPNRHVLPAELLVDTLLALGLYEGPFAQVLAEGYSHAKALVGGAFVAPDLLYDRDDGGRDATDESWSVDAARRTVDAEPRRIAFTCVVPKDNPELQRSQPHDVVLVGHGYGGNRTDVFRVAYAAARWGMATCGLDYPGHGTVIPEEDLEPYREVIRAAGLEALLEHITDHRAVDVDNDGIPESGADQWTSMAFHTRDMVRQAALDSSSFVRALRSCGSGDMGVDTDGDGALEASCDWDGNGVPDLGTTSARYFYVGGSLGGINSTVAAAIEPSVTATAAVVSGGGLLDIGTRSNIGGAVEALSGRLWSPLFLGIPDGEGGLDVLQHVNSGFMWMRSVPVGHLDGVPVGGRVLLENLDKGSSRGGAMPGDGRFRIGIAADALGFAEKKVATGMPDSGPQAGQVYELENNEGLGDRLRLRFFDASGAEIAVLDTFAAEQVFEGITLRADSPLVALNEGLGHIRNSPAHRRVVSSLSMVTEPGDPISYAPHLLLEPFEALFEGPVNLLQVNTPGDPIVTTNAAVAQARATGLIEGHEVDPAYGKTHDAYLIDTRVVQGLEEFGPYRLADGLTPALYDPDDLDAGADGHGDLTSEGPPLRLGVETESGILALRMPYESPTGSHGPGNPDPARPFDVGTFTFNQIMHYLSTGGRELSDDPCLEDDSCSFLPRQSL
jgi:hypothetical protein